MVRMRSQVNLKKHIELQERDLKTREFVPVLVLIYIHLRRITVKLSLRRNRVSLVVRWKKMINFHYNTSK